MSYGSPVGPWPGTTAMAIGVHTPSILRPCSLGASELNAGSRRIRVMHRRVNDAPCVWFPGRSFRVALGHAHAFSDSNRKHAPPFGRIHRARRPGKRLPLLGRRAESTYIKTVALRAVARPVHRLLWRFGRARSGGR